MENIIKKLTYASLGLVSLGRKKVEELAKEISQQTKLSEEEGRKLAEEWTAESEKIRVQLDDTVKKSVSKTIKRLDIPSREEIQSLENRIRVLENLHLQENKGQKEV